MDKIFGMTSKALELCEERAVTLNKNLVNSSTPHYKARDMDFQHAMKNVQGSAQGLAQTNPAHISTGNSAAGHDLKYRVPMQTSLDGNTVDPNIERKNFIENALRYQVNLTFMRNDSDKLVKSIKGE